MIEGVRHASSNSVAQILELLLDEYCVQQLNKFEGETLVSVIEEGLPSGSVVKNVPEMRETWVGKIPWRRERLPTPVF